MTSSVEKRDAIKKILINHGVTEPVIDIANAIVIKLEEMEKGFK